MVRTALLALVLAVGGGATSFGGVLDMVTIWAADEVDAGSIWDPFGRDGATSGSTTNGSDAGNDAGSIWDPLG